MKRRAGFGGVSDSDLVVKPPEPGSAPLPPEKGRKTNDEEARALHERAMADVRESRRHRNETIRAAVWAFLKSVVPIFVVIGAVFGAIAYDASLHQGSWRAILEYFVAVFGAVFSLFLWAWSRR